VIDSMSPRRSIRQHVILLTDASAQNSPMLTVRSSGGGSCALVFCARRRGGSAVWRITVTP
jgi:hypothetical protein